MIVIYLRFVILFRVVFDGNILKCLDKKLFEFLLEWFVSIFLKELLLKDFKVISLIRIIY